MRYDFHARRTSPVGLQKSLYGFVVNGGNLQDGAVTSGKGSYMQEANALPYVFLLSLQLEVQGV